MADDERGRKLDLSKMEFPTDRITIGDMRRIDGHLFDAHPALHRVAAISIGALATSSFEHRLAHKAFNQAAGLPDPEPTLDRDEVVAGLSADYQQYGLSGGKRESAELIRKIESAAADQAQGQSRGGRGARGPARR